MSATAITTAIIETPRYTITDLINAIEEAKKEKVHEILARQPELANQKDFNGYLPLIYALRHPDGTDFEIMLINAGADLKNLSPYSNDTFLHRIVNKKDTDACDILAVAYAKYPKIIPKLLNQETKDLKETPLISAISKFRAQLALALIEIGADVKLKDYAEKTALFIAETWPEISTKKLVISALKEAEAYQTRMPKDGLRYAFIIASLSLTITPKSSLSASIPD